jgi:hypothetical protein
MTSEITIIVLLMLAILASTFMFIKSFDLAEERPNYFIALASICYYFLLASFVLFGIYCSIND